MLRPRFGTCWYINVNLHHNASYALSRKEMNMSVVEKLLCVCLGSESKQANPPLLVAISSPPVLQFFAQPPPKPTPTVPSQNEVLQAPRWASALRTPVIENANWTYVSFFVPTNMIFLEQGWPRCFFFVFLFMFSMLCPSSRQMLDNSPALATNKSSRQPKPFPTERRSAKTWLWGKPREK